MKIKKIIAAVAATAVALSTMAVNAFAANLLDADVDLGTGWSDVAIISADKFADVNEGDVLSVTVTLDTEESYNLVSVKTEAAGWPKLECSTSAQGAIVEKNQDDGMAALTGDGTVTYTLTAADVATIKETGLLIHGYAVVVTNVEVGAAPAAVDAGTPAGDGDTTSQKTGNAPAVAMVSVMALAGAAAVASKKRK